MSSETLTHPAAPSLLCQGSCPPAPQPHLEPQVAILATLFGRARSLSLEALSRLSLEAF